MGVLRVMRPTLYKEEYCQMLIDHMAKGLLFESFAAVINVNRDTLYNWCERHEMFFDAKKIGREKMLLSDDILYNKSMRGDVKGVPSLLIFKMKNCHKWRDNDNQNHEDDELEIERRDKVDDSKEVE